jgi:hypothetical protein
LLSVLGIEYQIVKDLHIGDIFDIIQSVIDLKDPDSAKDRKVATNADLMQYLNLKEEQTGVTII